MVACKEGLWGTGSLWKIKGYQDKKIFFNDTDNHIQVQTSDDYFKINVFFKTIDIITNQLKNRSSGLYKIYSYFHVLFLNILRDPSLSETDIYDMSQDLHLKYPEDIAHTITYN